MQNLSVLIVDAKLFQSKVNEEEDDENLYGRTKKKKVNMDHLIIQLDL